jgi:hypothetical protein
MKRSATANWKGTGKEGKGLVSTQSPLFNDAYIQVVLRKRQVLIPKSLLLLRMPVVFQ